MAGEEQSWASLAAVKDAYRMLVLKYASSATAIAYAYVSDPKLASRIVEETFVQAYGQLSRAKSEDRFVRLVAKLARTFGRRYARMSRRMPRPADEERPPVTGEISKAVASLSEAHRVILNCRYLRAMSHEEIAALLGGDIESVSSRLGEAVRALSIRLARKYAWEVEKP